jgi:thiamine-monophosphate kinase
VDEFEFIDWIRQQPSIKSDVVGVGPGDDCAVLRIDREQVLVTTDQCADGVHFLLPQCGAEAAGYKVMARNLSDIAAMAGLPMAAVATVMLPHGMADKDVQDIYRGLRRSADAFGCPLVGGDVGSWDGRLLLTVTLLGRPAVGKPILRSGAKIGDAICVTGTLGGSLPSGKHLHFTPRISEAADLAGRVELHAMIDISDGLAADLGHICRESGLGAEIVAENIPLSTAAEEAEDPLAAALSDGEDYELLFTLPPEQAELLIKEQPLAPGIAYIGQIVARPEMKLRIGGKLQPMEPRGYRHRA